MLAGADKAWLLADMVGAVRLFGVLPEEAVAAAEARYLGEMERAVGMFGGRVLDAVGDEMLAEFDQAADAWRATRELQLQIGALPPVGGLRLASRCGLHLAPAVQPGQIDAAQRAVAMLTVRAGGGQVVASREFVAALGEPVAGQPLEGEILPGLGGVLLAWHPGARPVPAPDGVAGAAVATGTGPGQVPPGSGPADGLRLRLTVEGRVIALDGVRVRSLRVGRDPACEVLITDRRASRQHGRLYCRGDDLVYADCSTNGSFVLQGRHERFIRNEEVILRESGKLCFGGSANDPGAVCIPFEVVAGTARST